MTKLPIASLCSALALISVIAGGCVTKKEAVTEGTVDMYLIDSFSDSSPHLFSAGDYARVNSAITAAIRKENLKNVDAYFIPMEDRNRLVIISTWFPGEVSKEVAKKIEAGVQQSLKDVFPVLQRGATNKKPNQTPEPTAPSGRGSS